MPGMDEERPADPLAAVDALHFARLAFLDRDALSTLGGFGPRDLALFAHVLGLPHDLPARSIFPTGTLGRLLFRPLLLRGLGSRRRRISQCKPSAAGHCNRNP